MKKTLLVLLILIVYSSIFYFYCRPSLAPTHPTTNPVATTTVSASQSDWKTYGNTAFGYRIQYPNGVTVEPLDRYDYTTPISEKGEVSVGTVNIVIWRDAGTTGFSVAENKKLVSLNLKSFAEAIRAYQTTAKSTSQGIRVSDLREVSFASSTAYSFDLSGTFTNSEGGYLIPTGITDRYIFAEIRGHTKVMLMYPINDTIAQQVVDSFEFTK